MRTTWLCGCTMVSLRTILIALTTVACLTSAAAYRARTGNADVVSGEYSLEAHASTVWADVGAPFTISIGVYHEAPAYQAVQWRVEYSHDLVQILDISKAPAAPGDCANLNDDGLRILLGCIDILAPSLTYSGDAWLIGAACHAPGIAQFTIVEGTQSFVSIGSVRQPVHVHRTSVECTGKGTPLPTRTPTVTATATLTPATTCEGVGTSIRLVSAPVPVHEGDLLHYRVGAFNQTSGCTLTDVDVFFMAPGETLFAFACNIAMILPGETKECAINLPYLVDVADATGSLFIARARAMGNIESPSLSCVRPSPRDGNGPSTSCFDAITTSVLSAPLPPPTPTPTPSRTPSATPTATIAAGPPCADWTGDGKVDGRDVALVARHAGSTDAAYDLNGDGVVGARDIVVAAHQIGNTC